MENKQVQGLGDKRVIDGKASKVGAGGIGGGVKLTVSDEKTQQQNKLMLEAFLRREERKRKREERRRKESQA